MISVVSTTKSWCKPRLAVRYLETLILTMCFTESKSALEYYLGMPDAKTRAETIDITKLQK
jgi:hypothetical protein